MCIEGMRCLRQLPAELHQQVGREKKVSINLTFQGAQAKCTMPAAESCRVYLGLSAEIDCYTGKVRMGAVSQQELLDI